MALNSYQVPTYEGGAVSSMSTGAASMAQSINTGRLNVNASPEDFGAIEARSMLNLGAQFGQISSQISGKLEEHAKLHDMLWSEEIQIETRKFWETKIAKGEINDPVKFENDFKAYIDKTTANAPSDRARKLLELDLMKYGAGVTVSLIRKQAVASAQKVAEVQMSIVEGIHNSIDPNAPMDVYASAVIEGVEQKKEILANPAGNSQISSSARSGSLVKSVILNKLEGQAVANPQDAINFVNTEWAMNNLTLPQRDRIQAGASVNLASNQLAGAFPSQDQDIAQTFSNNLRRLPADEQAKAVKKFEQIRSNRNEQITQLNQTGSESSKYDPALVAMRGMFSDVKQIETLTGEVKTKATEDLIQKSIDMQLREGVSPRILTIDQRNTLANQIAFLNDPQSDPTSADAFLNSMRQNYGKFYPQAINELRYAGVGLEKITALSFRDHPEFRNIFKAVSDPKLSKLDRDVASTVTTKLKKTPFYKAINEHLGNSVSERLEFNEMMMNLSGYYMNMYGDATKATQKVNSIFLDKYNIHNVNAGWLWGGEPYIIPKDSPMAESLPQLLDKLQTDPVFLSNLATDTPADGVNLETRLLADNDFKRLVMKNIKWIVNSDGESFTGIDPITRVPYSMIVDNKSVPLIVRYDDERFIPEPQMVDEQEPQSEQGQIRRSSETLYDFSDKEEESGSRWIKSDKKNVIKDSIINNLKKHNKMRRDQREKYLKKIGNK